MFEKRMFIPECLAGLKYLLSLQHPAFNIIEFEDSHESQWDGDREYELQWGDLIEEGDGYLLIRRTRGANEFYFLLTNWNMYPP